MFTKQTGPMYLMKSWVEKKNSREETLSYDEHSVGVFKKDGTLVGHAPIELSRLTDYFMKVKMDLLFQRNLQLLPKNWEL